MIDKSILPAHWEVKKLGEIFNFIGGGTPDKSNKNYWEGDISWASVKDIKGKYLTRTQDTISEVGLSNSSAQLALPGEIILITRISPGKTALSKIKSAINQDLKIVKPKIEINTLFILYLFQTIEKEVIKNSSGTTVLGIRLDKLKEIKVSLPPLSEQKEIVSKIEELFSELDKGKEQLETARQQLKVYRQAVLKWAFEGRFTNLETKDSGLPNGWKWVKLGEIVTNVEYGSATKSKEVGSIPVLRMGNIQNGKFNWDNLVYTDDQNEIERYLLKKNDVLFNRTNSAELVGKTAIYKAERPAIFAGYLIRINRIESLIDAEYLNYYLNTHMVRQYGNTVRSFGVNQSNINGTKLKTYPIPLAPLKEQQIIVQEIESRLSVCDKVEETISKSLRQAEALRQSILKQAFEGKLVTTDTTKTNIEQVHKQANKVGQFQISFN